MVWAALRTEVPEAAGMLPPEEPPDGRVAVPVVRGALEPELVLLLVVRPVLPLELELEELESESESEELELLSSESELLESLSSLSLSSLSLSSLSLSSLSLSSLSLDFSLIWPHEAQGLLLSLLLSPAETELP